MSLPSPKPEDTILITGASAGIGTELARQLAERGHGVTFVARRQERLDELAEELRQAHGTDVDVHACDLADDGARAALVDSLLNGPKRVAAVCNNAGYGSFGRFWELPRESEANMVRLNCLALVDLTHAFLTPMVDRGEGAILEVGSMAAFQPTPWNSTYSATKAFVLSFSEGVSAELAGTGVSLTVLCPGPGHDGVRRHRRGGGSGGGPARLPLPRPRGGGACGHRGNGPRQADASSRACRIAWSPRPGASRRARPCSP